jgi:hypothetical protein
MCRPRSSGPCSATLWCTRSGGRGARPATGKYRAEVTLTPSPDGTLIRWGASWDRTIMGRLVYPSLRKLYPVIVAGLVKAAEAPDRTA